MKTLRKIISVFIILLLSVAVIFGYNYAKKNLESLVSVFLKDNFNVTASVGSMKIGFPLCVELRDVKIGDSVDIKKVRIYPNPAPFLLKKNFIVSSVKIVEPVIKIKRGKREGSLSIPDFLKKIEQGVSSDKGSAPLSNFYFSRMHVQDGTLIYEEGRENALEFINIRGNIQNAGIFSPKGGVCQFAATGFLKNKDSDFLSPLGVTGFVKSDNLIKIKAQIDDVKVGTFGSIYAKYLSNLIQEGSVDCKSDIHLSNKNLIAKCFLEGQDIVLKKDQGQKLDAPVLASFILLVNFKSSLVKIKNLEGNFLDIILGRK